MSTLYDSAVETARDVGGRLARDLPASLSSGVVPLDWPDGLVDRVSGDLTHGIDLLRDAVVPAATAAAGAGTNAAISGGRTVKRHPALLAVGGVAAIALVVWLVRRSRPNSEHAAHDNVESATDDAATNADGAAMRPLGVA